MMASQTLIVNGMIECLNRFNDTGNSLFLLTVKYLISQFDFNDLDKDIVDKDNFSIVVVDKNSIDEGNRAQIIQRL